MVEQPSPAEEVPPVVEVPTPVVEVPTPADEVPPAVEVPTPADEVPPVVEEPTPPVEEPSPATQPPPALPPNPFTPITLPLNINPGTCCSYTALPPRHNSPAQPTPPTQPLSCACSLPSTAAPCWGCHFLPSQTCCGAACIHQPPPPPLPMGKHLAALPTAAWTTRPPCPPSTTPSTTHGLSICRCIITAKVFIYQ